MAREFQHTGMCLDATSSAQTCSSALEPRPFVYVAQPGQETIPAFDQEHRCINPSSINCH